jgi:hypothetical protein
MADRNDVNIPILNKLNLSAKDIKEMTNAPWALIEDYMKLNTFCSQVSFFLNDRGKDFWSRTHG